MVPPCMLSPGLQADKGNSIWRKEFVRLLLKYDADFLPFVCAEASLNDYQQIVRLKHGVDYYKNVQGYQEHCKKQAQELCEQIAAFNQNGYRVWAIMGIEHSPSCAVNYLYTHSGTQKRSGLFMGALMECLTEKEIVLNYIGINRKYPRKALLLLEETIKKIKYHMPG